MGWWRTAALGIGSIGREGIAESVSMAAVDDVATTRRQLMG